MFNASDSFKKREEARMKEHWKKMVQNYKDLEKRIKNSKNSKNRKINKK